jgi:hypothetical protein
VSIVVNTSHLPSKRKGRGYGILTGVTDLLGGRLLLLGLDGRGGRVEGTLDGVRGLLEVRLLRVGLDGRSSLVTERLTALLRSVPILCSDDRSTTFLPNSDVATPTLEKKVSEGQAGHEWTYEVRHCVLVVWLVVWLSGEE